MRLKISRGSLYDPASGRHGEAADLYIDGDRIVARLSRVDRVIEAQGKAVVAGGIDLRGQVATYGLNFRRAGGGLPSPRELGKAYAALGYTHVHEPFLTLATANYVHRQLAALPVVDTSASLVLNLRDLDLSLGSSGQLPVLRETVAFLLEKTRALNLRVVEPFVRYRQEFYASRTLAMGKALEVLAALAGGQNHPLALEASPAVLRADFPEPAAFHLSALGPALEEDEVREAALAKLESGATADMGLMHPVGPEPGPHAVRVDMGWFEPLELAPGADKAAARRALELALQYRGEALAFSGAGNMQVRDYPRLLAWLGDRGARNRDWGQGLEPRELTLGEWARATRNLPARLLGLKDRGHLAPGARADVAIFESLNRQGPGSWPGRCHTLLKAGEVVVDGFELVKPDVTRATYFRPTGAAETPLVQEICQFRSLRPENLWVRPEVETSWEKI